MVNVNIREISVRKGENWHTLLKNIYFNLDPANVYSILGKNGSGKTTLLKALTSLLDKRFFDVQGQVLFKGTNLVGLEEARLIDLRKKYVKYVFQDPVLSFDPMKKLSYYTELLLPDKEKMKKWLDFFLLPGIDKINNMHSYELSGGMAQRLAVAFALSAEPILLCMDEPNSGIDHAISYLISDALKTFVKESNSIVLVITQDLTFAEHTGNFTGLLTGQTFSGFSTTAEFFSKTDKKLIFSGQD